MQKVSKTYKNSMKSSLRERAYIMLTFGLINQEAQAKAKIGNWNFTYYSNIDNIFGGNTDDVVYATLEDNFTKVDGSMFFLPRQSTADKFYDTGLVGERLVSEEQYELFINLNTTLPVNFRGLTINFGENYPVNFDVIGSNNTVQVRDNNKAEWSTEEVFENTTYLRLVFTTMKNRQSRLRIYSIRFGYGLVYYNDSVMSSQLDSYVSPIGADVPQIDFSVTLKNYDHYFNVDNPKSAINYFETGQEMNIMYGYQLPDSEDIEWIQGNHLLCSGWESDDNTATIRCQDIFRNMDSEYIKGSYNSSGKDYFTLATEILKDAGITDYYIDPRLKQLYTRNPMPRVKHKEGLQIIANACRCTLSQSRFGKIQIKSNFIPELTATSDDASTVSKVNNILKEDEKDEYGMMIQDYTVVTGGMFFTPSSGKGNRNVGYISSMISKADRTFIKNPKITITAEAVRAYSSLKMTFGSTLPSAFTIRTFNSGSPVSEFDIGEDEIDKVTMIIRDFDDFDSMEIEFTKTAVPYNRIVLHNFSLDEVTDFTMTRNDMLSSPKAIKQELIKDVVVPCYSYQTTTQIETLITEEVDVKSGQVETYYLDAPSYGFSITSGQAEIIEWGDYYFTVRFKVTGSYKLEIKGNRYKIVETYVTKTLHDKGKTIKWSNPLISDMTMAQDLAEWLAEYYTAGIEYEYDTRGNPEIDATDIIYQENEFYDDMKVTIYRHTIGFKDAFSGKVTARRIGG